MCRWRYKATNPAHARIPGECKYPWVEGHKYTCPGCKRRDNWDQATHTYQPGECAAAEQPTRIGGTKRKGKHPRAPAVPRSIDPTTDAQAQLEDGEGFAPYEEEPEAAEDAATRQAAKKITIDPTRADEIDETNSTAAPSSAQADQVSPQVWDAK